MVLLNAWPPQAIVLRRNDERKGCDENPLGTFQMALGLLVSHASCADGRILRVPRHRQEPVHERLHGQNPHQPQAELPRAVGRRRDLLVPQPSDARAVPQPAAVPTGELRVRRGLQRARPARHPVSAGPRHRGVAVGHPGGRRDEQRSSLPGRGERTGKGVRGMGVAEPHFVITENGRFLKDRRMVCIYKVI